MSIGLSSGLGDSLDVNFCVSLGLGGFNRKFRRLNRFGNLIRRRFRRADRLVDDAFPRPPRR